MKIARSSPLFYEKNFSLNSSHHILRLGGVILCAGQSDYGQKIIFAWDIGSIRHLVLHLSLEDIGLLSMHAVV